MLWHRSILSRNGASTNPGALQFAVGATGGAIAADQYSWAQPTNLQDAAAIEAIVGTDIITDTPGLYPGGFYPGDGAVTPLVRDDSTPGVLIDAIPDAKGTVPVGANALRDPLTGDPILFDVFGNERWDGNDASNIGAIQTVFAPHLTVAGVSDGRVDLTWNQVISTNPTYPVDKYFVQYRIAGSADPWTEIEIPDPDQLFETVTGLTNGVEYEFKVHAHAVAPVGDLPDSNVVEATPLGEAGIPDHAAIGGAGAVQLFWTEPPLGGHPGPPSYFVVYRVAGTSEWFAGPRYLSGRTTIIPGLDPGTTYEFGVFALTTDGTTSPDVGVTTAATDPGPDPEPDPADQAARFTG